MKSNAKKKSAPKSVATRLPKIWEDLLSGHKKYSKYELEDVKKVQMKTSHIHNRNKFARIMKTGFKKGSGVAGFVLNAIENNRTIPVGLILAPKASFRSKDKYDFVVRNMGSKNYSKAVHESITTGAIVDLLPKKLKIMVSAIQVSSTTQSKPRSKRVVKTLEEARA